MRKILTRKRYRSPGQNFRPVYQYEKKQKLQINTREDKRTCGVCCYNIFIQIVRDRFRLRYYVLAERVNKFIQ